MNKKNHRRNRRGFTIVEILVVVVIIGVLATLIVPAFIGRMGEARRAVATAKLPNIETAIMLFRQDYDRWPVSLDEIVSRPADIDEAKWNQPTLRAKDLLDPWGRQFLYREPGEHGAFDLYSLGKDGQQGGEKDNADVINW